MTSREKHRQITKNLARMERLRESLIRQYDALRDLKATEPQWKARYARLQKTLEKLKGGSFNDQA